MRWRPPLTLAAGFGEPGRAFLARLAFRNAERNVGRFARCLGLDEDGVRRGHGIAELEQAARLAAGSLREWSPVVDPCTRTLTLHGNVLRMQDWDATSRRWCPACLADDLMRARSTSREPERLSYHRAWWDLRPIVRCPAHGVELRSGCPACGAAQTIDRRDLTRCACSAKLANVGVGQVDHVSRYLHGRLANTDRPTIPILDRLDLSDVVPLLDRLGLAALSEPGIPWASLRAIRDAERHSAGTTLAMGWPASFEQVLDRAVSAAVSSGRKGMLGTYGWIHEHWINAMPAGGTGDTFKTVLRTHALRRGVVAEGEALLGQEGRPGTVDLTAAARILGVAHPRAVRVLEQNGLLTRGRRRGVGMVLDASAVRAVVARRRRRLDLSGVRSRLRVGRSQARAIATKLLHPGDHGPSPGSAQRGYDCDRLASLASSIRAVAPSVEAIPIGHLPLPRACQSAGVPLEVALRAVLDGTMGCLLGPGDTIDSLQSMFVSPEALRKLRPKAAVLSLKDAATALGIHHDAVLELARHGAIPARRERGGWRFEPEAIDRFNADHIPASVVARRLGTSPRKVLHDLLDLGIRPAFGPPRFRQAVLSRSDLIRSNMPMLAGWADPTKMRVPGGQSAIG